MSLTAEQKTILNNEVVNDPLLKGYSTYLPDQSGKVVELLNEVTETMIKERMITARGILSDYPGGPSSAATVLDKLETAAPSIPALKWAFKFLTTPEGLNIGHSATQGMIDFLATTTGGDILTTTEAGHLKSLALMPASRAEVLGLPFMTTELFLSRTE